MGSTIKQGPLGTVPEGEAVSSPRKLMRTVRNQHRKRYKGNQARLEREKDFMGTWEKITKQLGECRTYA